MKTKKPDPNCKQCHGKGEVLHKCHCGECAPSCPIKGEDFFPCWCTEAWEDDE